MSSYPICYIDLVVLSRRVSEAAALHASNLDVSDVISSLSADLSLTSFHSSQLCCHFWLLHTHLPRQSLNPDYSAASVNVHTSNVALDQQRLLSCNPAEAQA